MSTLRQFQAEVAARMSRGEAFASVEDEVIDPSGLSEREKAALWLYGWSFVDWRHQRREAVGHIEQLVARENAVGSRPPGFRAPASAAPAEFRGRRRGPPAGRPTVVSLRLVRRRARG